jgi:hypothetical protein
MKPHISILLIAIILVINSSLLIFEFFPLFTSKLELFNLVLCLILILIFLSINKKQRNHQ